jgi:hypothetical protein
MSYKFRYIIKSVLKIAGIGNNLPQATDPKTTSEDEMLADNPAEAELKLKKFRSLRDHVPESLIEITDVERKSPPKGGEDPKAKPKKRRKKK